MQQTRQEKSTLTLVQEGLDYWIKKCGDRQMPNWSDINPSDIKHLLPNIVLIHVQHDPLDFVERITGEIILSHSAKNSMGKNWRTYEGRGPDSQIWKSMEDVVHSRTYSLKSIPYVGPQKYFKGIQTVICPISEDGNSVSRLLAFVDYIPREEQQLESEIALQHLGRFTLLT